MLDISIRLYLFFQFKFIKRSWVKIDEVAELFEVFIFHLRLWPSSLPPLVIFEGMSNSNKSPKTEFWPSAYTASRSAFSFLLTVAAIKILS